MLPSEAPHFIVSEVHALEQEFPHARWLREIVYATYRNPPQIVDTRPYQPMRVDHGWIINAAMPANVMLNKRLPPHHYVNSIEGLSDELASSPLNRLGGFYRYQIADIPSTGVNGYIPPIEAFELMKFTNTQWPFSLEGMRIGYISQMVINLRIPTSQKPQILNAIHQRASQLAREKGVDLTLAIMTPQVAVFAESAGLTVHRLGGHPRWRDEEGNLSIAAETIFKEFPGYWKTEDTPLDEQPTLWQVDLFE